jgi:hypothetical protein
MKIVKESRKGIPYLTALLKEKASVVTKILFYKIKRSSIKEEIRLKIGRYNKGQGWNPETLESDKPRSELTLDNVEFQNLIKFLQENYTPFIEGAKKYISIDSENIDQVTLENLKIIFNNPDRKKVLEFIAKNKILPEELLTALENQKRINAIKKFEEMMQSNLVENDWQSWFVKNDWVLGSEFVRILNERKIDTHNISDYLMQAYDGFLDIIEIKRPEGKLKFWATSKDHDNPIPSSDLIKAITQATKYIYEVEREANSVKFLERVNYVKTIKPRCVLIFGRSDNWIDNEKEAFRILNASYHNISIMTYDHVLSRAKRIVGLKTDKIE